MDFLICFVDINCNTAFFGIENKLRITFRRTFYMI